MGCYIYLTETDLQNRATVDDKEMQILLDCALQFDKSLIVREYSVYKSRGWFRKPVEEKWYSVYHEIFNEHGKSMFQAREQLYGSGSREGVMTYLCGILNGVNSLARKLAVDLKDVNDQIKQGNKFKSQS